MPLKPLVNAATLAAHLGDPGWIPVDCRFDLASPGAGRAAYRQGHIPGARYAHLDDDLAAPPRSGDGRHPLPEPAVFAARLAAWGISDDSTVVAYDAGAGTIAARLWWMMGWLGHARVHVLDGGLGAWQAEGLNLQSGTPEWRPETFRVKELRQDRVVTTDQLPGLLEKGAVLLDARAEERFLGRAEPIDPVAGHIPGARSFPFSRTIASHGRLRAADALRTDLLPLLGGRAPQDVIAMCGSGVTACHLLLSMEVAGLGRGRLYVGSWSEWIRDPDRPVVTSHND